MTTFLGIDAGTTNIKAVLLDEAGRLLERVSAPVPVLRPFEGASEIDMQGLWELLCTATKSLREQASEAAWKGLAGVAVSAQGDGMWAIAKDGTPAGPAILWNDTRAGDFGDIDMAEIDKYLQTQASTALFAGALPNILKWLAQNNQDYYSRIYRAGHCKDWLNFRLTGLFVSDCTDFSTAGINIFSRRHIAGLYDRLGISKAAFMMPELVDTLSIIGAVTKEAANQTGIPAGLPVAAGVMDVVATALGAGVTEPGDGCTILGTTLCNEILISQEQVDVSNRSGSALCSVFPGKYVRVMAALSGNSTIDWAKGVLAPELSFQQLEDQLEQIPPGSRGVLYHPYVTGERAPFRDPFACGGFYGLNVRHTRLEMLRAAYEGMALSIRDCFNSLPALSGRLYLSGGGAVSDFTCRLVAGALNREVYRQGNKELGARGAVEALRLTLGLPPMAGRDKADVFQPMREEQAAFDEMYPQFTQLRGGMEDFWKQRRRLLS